MKIGSKDNIMFINLELLNYSQAYDVSSLCYYKLFSSFGYFLCDKVHFSFYSVNYSFTIAQCVLYLWTISIAIKKIQSNLKNSHIKIKNLKYHPSKKF